jgi:hypothetical protein
MTRPAKTLIKIKIKPCHREGAQLLLIFMGIGAGLFSCGAVQVAWCKHEHPSRSLMTCIAPLAHNHY